MLKKLTLAISLLVGLSGCQQKKTNTSMAVNQGEASVSSDCSSKTKSSCGSDKTISLKSVEELQNKAENLVDKQVSVSGIVTHVCKHSGKRCFISTLDEKFKIRVEANDQIKTFNQDLIGNEITVTGIVRVKKTEKAQKETEHNHNHDGQNHEGHETCQSEKEEAKQMAENSNDKDYIAVYFIDGISYKLAKN